MYTLNDRYINDGIKLMYYKDDVNNNITILLLIKYNYHCYTYYYNNYKNYNNNYKECI